ncbi:uncharacterized protein LOC115881428 [Sitophilus oryzae]|uniref:Uncharacterized protein LOC115881428 n=1 Tax=Sitophilus oryzae TaxID=7048 RepID=A0A6J2XUQ2_SITOR|nr:uncharacterized protein LOC115881428 [Sitophilus oryzae]
MQQHPPDNEFVHVDISVSPVPPPVSAAPSGPKIPPKLLAIMKKYKYNWRLDQLAKPKMPIRKYVPREIGLIKAGKIPLKRLSDEIQYYSDQISRPPLRSLYCNKHYFENISKNYKKKITKNINKAWDSIYNYYKKKERDRKLRLLRKQATGKEKKRELDMKRHDELAKPKALFKPEPIKPKKPPQIFSNYGRLDTLATPRPCIMQTPKSLEVNPAALTYEATETVIRLAKLPPRLLNLPKPLEPGKVKKSALRYNATPRIIEIAMPKQRSDKSKEDEDFDPFAISKKALTYKPTPRIIEMAKPKERD